MDDEELRFESRQDVRRYAAGQLERYDAARYGCSMEELIERLTAAIVTAGGFGYDWDMREVVNDLYDEQNGGWSRLIEHETTPYTARDVRNYVARDPDNPSRSGDGSCYWFYFDADGIGVKVQSEDLPVWQVEKFYGFYDNKKETEDGEADDDDAEEKADDFDRPGEWDYDALYDWAECGGVFDDMATEANRQRDKLNEE